MKVKEIIRSTEWIPNPQKADQTPRFSIIMPTYRRFASGHLTRAIQSVLNQTYHQFELIVIDDGSVDGSFQEIQRFMTLDSRIHCLRHPVNVGLPAIGCYEAFLKSRGEYLMFCFDDTEYQEKALESVDQYTSAHKPNVAFGYIDYRYKVSYYEASQAFLGKNKVSQAHLQMTNFLPNLGAIIHRNVINEIGFYDPHLAVARMTDWDYWKRAARVYEIHYSDIHIGTEFGLVTRDSLGLTYPLNTWMAYEWTELERNAALVPGTYEEYDVQHIPENLSDQSKLALLDLSQFYSEKFWYQAPGPLTLSTSAQATGLDPNSKILVLTRVQDASITLTFEHLPEARTVIRYVSPFFFDPRELINASAVIISRHLFSPEMHQWVDMARQLAIPHYYYLDDNFMVLSEELPELREYTLTNMMKELASFQGVLVPSRKLADFFLEKKIHSRIFYFPPVISNEKWLDRTELPEKRAGTTRIGFLGGLHRRNDFINIVLPAIVKLAQDHDVELVIGGNHNLANPNDYAPLRIYQIPFDPSYRLALGRMQSAQIDILVHSGSSTQNNPYKTRNALLNAGALQAFPILSNQPPYDDIEGLGLGLLCKQNDTDNWYQNLKMAISDPSLMARAQKNLQQYLTEHYSGKPNLDVLKTISQECHIPGASVIDNRFRIYLNVVEADRPLSTAWKPVTERGRAKMMAILRLNRPWLLPAKSPQERAVRFLIESFRFLREAPATLAPIWNPLTAQGMVRLVNRLEYEIRPEAERWIGFECMIEAPNPGASGQVVIEIIDENSGTMMRQHLLELTDIKDNQITKITFEPIDNSIDKAFKVRFLLQAEDPEASLSVYEKNKMESKFRQILRRMGLITRGNTLACRLLYEDK